ncbi:MAG: TlpA disulfide reductase family protein [Phycisphaerales bacterium]|jgi:thiol-disulfide isomerase/thioredoxin|nr:TlpA disulfide reductase family protein [Phycisphaerales bacterium]
MATISTKWGAAVVAGALALTGALATGMGAKKETLKAGDDAPKLEVNEWIKGDPITELQKGHVYVVEYWATWCPPCVKSIPHMTELQKEYKEQDVHFIGVAAFERKGRDNLKSFVEKKGDEMNYRIAYASDGKAAKAWMEAAGKNAIPTAFVIGRDGKIAWIGNPLSGLDKAVGDAAKAPSEG